MKINSMWPIFNKVKTILMKKIYEIREKKEKANL